MTSYRIVVGGFHHVTGIAVSGGFHQVCVVIGLWVLISSSCASVVFLVVVVHQVEGLVSIVMGTVGFGFVANVSPATVLKLKGGSIVVISWISYVNISVK